MECSQTKIHEFTFFVAADHVFATGYIVSRIYVEAKYYESNQNGRILRQHVRMSEIICDVRERL